MDRRRLFSVPCKNGKPYLTAHPLDLFALSLVHYTDVLLGDVVGQRDVVARVFNLWDEGIPGYEFVLGFYAFGLEENRDFRRKPKNSAVRRWPFGRTTLMRSTRSGMSWKCAGASPAAFDS